MSIVDKIKGVFSSNETVEDTNDGIEDLVNNLVEDKISSLEQTNDNYSCYIKDFQFKDDTEICRVDFPSKLEKIGIQAFDGCVNLKTINFYNNEPPIICNDAFTNVNGAIVSVPSGCLDKYLNTANIPNKDSNEYKEEV